MSIRPVGNVVGARLQGIRAPVGEIRLCGATPSTPQRQTSQLRRDGASSTSTSTSSFGREDGHRQLKSWRKKPSQEHA
jgi:hypothetical protein